MKQPANFRLSGETQALLARLASERGVSKTEVLEDAVKAYARKQGKVQKEPHPMREFFGIWADADEEALNAAMKRHGSRPIPKW